MDACSDHRVLGLNDLNSDVKPHLDADEPKYCACEEAAVHNPAQSRAEASTQWQIMADGSAVKPQSVRVLATHAG